jgi:carboxylesterase type B
MKFDGLQDPIMNPLEIFAPSIEETTNNSNIFLSQHPYDILKAGKASKVPILTGLNSEEGLLVTASKLMSGFIGSCKTRSRQLNRETD